MVALVAISCACGPGANAQDGGISQEEYLRTFPPAPVAVRAAALDDGIIIFWEAPARPAPDARLAYDPEVAMYRVYRLGPEQNRTLIGETAGTWFIDTDARSGATHRYAATAVQRSGQESDLSQDFRLRVP